MHDRRLKIRVNLAFVDCALHDAGNAVQLLTDVVVCEDLLAIVGRPGLWSEAAHCGDARRRRDSLDQTRAL